MEKNIETQGVGELVSLAKKMRDSAAETMDLHYIALFLRVAAALEDRISQLVQDDDFQDRLNKNAASGTVAGYPWWHESRGVAMQKGCRLPDEVRP